MHGPTRRRVGRTGCALGLAVLLALVLAYVLLTGPRDEGLYPDRAASPYRLPWPAGVARLCVQGNRGIVSHREGEEFAYDFAMPVGSIVCAARGGVVSRVVIDHDGHGLEAPNNFVSVDHGDGTTGQYLHLERGGSLVRAGDRVTRGQPIARSGNVGRSLLPHLHFHVRGRDGATLPVTFADVEGDAGIPRMFSTYVSGNAP